MLSVILSKANLFGPSMFGHRHITDSSIILQNLNHSPTEEQVNKPEGTYPATVQGKCLGFGLLIFPTLVCTLLLASNFQGWEVTGDPYLLITQHRATTQLIVQVLANALSLTQVLVICRLINYATRILLSESTATLDMIGLWAAFSTPTMDWRLPLRMALPLLAFVGISPTLSAVWAGALTPVETMGYRDGIVSIPDWTNTSLVKEYPSEIDQTGPSVIDAKGHFTYSVGVGLLTSLVSSARSATTADGTVTTHFKLDNSGFAYRGRSYGVGASVGLTDDSITGNELATNYTFQEVGYDASVSCTYNDSSLFRLRPSGQDLLYAAAGPLPDSNGIREYSVYFGRNDYAIVAAGVSYIHSAGRRYVALAAGSYYEHLDSTQCSVDFNPALFNVSIGTISKEISVEKVSDAPDLDPKRNLTHVAMRQIELISNDLTSLYRSALGDALNTSISDYITSTSKLPNPPNLENATLHGLTNSVTSLIDDILGSYAAAQLMVGNFTTASSAIVQVSSFRLGSPLYIIAIAAVNAAIIALVVIEAFRTRGWRNLLSFDYTDLRSLVTASSLGGASTTPQAGPLDNITDKEQRGKMKVRLGTTHFPDKVRHFQVILGNRGAIYEHGMGGAQGSGDSYRSFGSADFTDANWI